MSIVRALDENNDWTFGKGKENYKANINTVAQNIQTRLSSFLGDCFFDNGAGVDWFNLLGAKNELAINLAVSATILNTENVTGLLQLNIELTENRRLTIQYRVQTAYSVSVENIFQYDLV